MVDALGDPTTRVRPVSAEAAARPAQGRDPDPRSWWARDSMLVVSLRNYQDLADFNRAIDRLKAIAERIRWSGTRGVNHPRPGPRSSTENPYDSEGP
jgi:hypothetical protein